MLKNFNLNQEQKKNNMLRQEGEVWTEKGKTWTIKNGIKRTISKFSKVRKDLQMPLCCPKCKNAMHKIDETFYKFNRVCLNCTVEFEHELRKQGKYEEYEKARVMANVKGYVLDLDSFMNDFLSEQTNRSFVTEDGDVEAWIGNASKRAEELVKPELDKLKEQFLK